ncbi:hypothetical protein HUX88_23500 [Duganella sp. BJB1802]|uniref:hypothetical protein n=1 Tax=Duganella sp. BJB1802 TaxID=2744575 RepID=UPI001594BE05|nr:hypothetical protein [Duganella sp. BJB1802]NVD73481.1 hypothetical protein [Duganella sp. BJB1802]
MRKRWDGESVYLIHLTHLLKIDAFSEAVWDKLDGRHTLEEIITSISSLFPDYQLYEVEAFVSANIINFHEAGFVDSGEKQ